jgi:hypothetical protein
VTHGEHTGRVSRHAGISEMPTLRACVARCITLQRCFRHNRRSVAKLLSRASQLWLGSVKTVNGLNTLTSPKRGRKLSP